MANPLRIARNGLRSLGLDVVRYPSRQREPLADFFQRFSIDLVLDVGANIGQYGEAIRNWYGYRGKIISFEPDPGAFQRLSEVARADGNWECHNVGLGDRPGEAVLNVSELSVFNSILKTTDYVEGLDSRARAARTVTVPIITLDQFWAEQKLSGQIFLKLDTQGYERPILTGAPESLQKATGLQLELSLAKLYDEQPLIEEMLPLLRERGFKLYEIWSGYADEHTGAILEVDGLFYRPDRTSEMNGASH